MGPMRYKGETDEDSMKLSQVADAKGPDQNEPNVAGFARIPSAHGEFLRIQLR